MKCANHIAEILCRDIMVSLKESIGFHDTIATSLAENVVKKLQQNWGGRTIYIPAPDSQERNAAIRKAFTGRNHAEVCQQFKISLRTLYRIIE